MSRMRHTPREEEHMLETLGNENAGREHLVTISVHEQTVDIEGLAERPGRGEDSLGTG